MSDQYKQQGDAEWDQRQAFHQRLHNAIMLCYDGMHNKDFEIWYDALLILYTELVNHMQPKEKDAVDKSMNKAKKIIKLVNLHSIDKKSIFNNAQIQLHCVMRSRGFDVPVVKSSPGSILMNEKSF